MTVPKTLKIKSGDADVVLSMPYGMLTELLRITGCDNAEVAAQLVVDLIARDLVIRRLLTPDLKEPMTEIGQLIPSFDVDLEPDTVDQVITWVLEHFMDFFVRSLKVLQTAEGRMAERSAVVMTA